LIVSYCNIPIPQVALVGNPNCGKTSLFNRLTGDDQRVGNWSGVTLSEKAGRVIAENGEVELIDLPGLYAILGSTSELGIDEKLSCDYLASQQPDCILNIVDAANLERNLYLTLQLLEQERPLIVIIHRVDLLHQQGKRINCRILSEFLGCPVFAMSCEIESVYNTQYIDEFKKQLVIFSTKHKNNKGAGSNSFKIDYPEFIEKLIGVSRAQSLSILEQQSQNDADIIIAQTRYNYIEKILAACVHMHSACTYNLKNNNNERSLGALVQKENSIKEPGIKQIDRLLLHRIWGIPIFLAVMYALFLFAINFGGAFQEFFDRGSNAIFVEGLAQALSALHFPVWLIAIVAAGLGRGINTLVTFIPVIGAMFFALSFLEESGYMARVAFVMDKLMQAIGLPGKSFVPMIIGFGCNVPAIMSTRTLERKRDRILTVIMSPFMSCGARLAIFTLFVAAFFPQGGQNIVFLLYLIGIIMALLTGLLLKKTLLQGAPSIMVLELPVFRMPSIKSISMHAFRRLKRFLKNASTLILPICMIIGTLNSISIKGELLLEADTQQDSLLAYAGKSLTPIFAPMGIKPDNWPATVGLCTGVLAKELVIGTLNSLYSQTAVQTQVVQEQAQLDIVHELQLALYSIPDNLLALGGALKNPLESHMELPDTLNKDRVYGEMQARFD